MTDEEKLAAKREALKKRIAELDEELERLWEEVAALAGPPLSTATTSAGGALKLESSL